MKTLKKISVLLSCILLLTACSTAVPPLDAPCDAYGQHCDPKIPINQWDRSAQQ